MPAKGPAAAVIYCCDDDSIVRETVADALTDEGYAVRGFDSAAEVWEALEAGQHPSMLLLDLVMPGMSGWELLEKMKSSPNLADIPICVLSAPWMRRRFRTSTRCCASRSTTTSYSTR